ncbi:MAG: ATP-binding cassette domain-containing protein [Bacillota bacterium]|nr:ATP-binding cassette domain-containing protein [Bacillota bacterium]
MIKVENLSKEYKINGHSFKAVDKVSFEVEKGQVFGIIGLSGAGKSTLVRCLNRLEEPSSGTIEIDGLRIDSLGEKDLLEARKNIGMIFQNFNLFNQRTVFENIAFPLKIQGKKDSEISDQVNELLDFVNLREKKDAYPVQLSGGQKQRVAIARALATKPKVLLSDESTSALDPENTEQILSLLKDAVEKYQMTIIIITHQMEVAKDICDYIAVMENGKIIESGKVEEIFSRPKTSRTKAFIKNLPDQVEEIALDKNDFTGKLYRLTFGQATVNEPIINRLLSESKCTINILSGNISTIGKNASSGYLTVEIQGAKEDIRDALDFLDQSKVNVEAL